MSHPSSHTLLSRSLGVMAALLWLAGCNTPPEPASGPVPNPLDMSMTPVSTGSSDDDTTANDSDHKDSFEVASLSDSDLSDMRGGFLLAGGLQLNFGLTTTTLVNGIIKSNVSISTDQKTSTLPQNLQQIVQVGTGNNFASPTTNPATTATVLTIVQNSTNNATISNKNELNLTVSNFSHFAVSNASLNSILPMVRALR